MTLSLKPSPADASGFPTPAGTGGSSDAEGPYRLVDDVCAFLERARYRAGRRDRHLHGRRDRLRPRSRASGPGRRDRGQRHRVDERAAVHPWAVQAFADWRAAEQGGDLQAWIDVLQRFTAGPRRTLDQVAPEGGGELIGTMARHTVMNHLRLAEDGTPLPPHPPTPVGRTWERRPTVETPVLQCAAPWTARITAATPGGWRVRSPTAASSRSLEPPTIRTLRTRALSTTPCARSCPPAGHEGPGRALAAARDASFPSSTSSPCSSASSATLNAPRSRAGATARRNAG